MTMHRSYTCNLCHVSHGDKRPSGEVPVYGVRHVAGRPAAVALTLPQDADNHLCAGCIAAIKAVVVPA